MKRRDIVITIADDIAWNSEEEAQQQIAAALKHHLSRHKVTVLDLLIGPPVTLAPLAKAKVLAFRAKH